jgi:predicted ArsR family transcriptional regulator
VTTETGLHRALADPSRVRVLEALRESPDALDASQLAALVGLHVNTVRSHLRVLAQAALVEASPEERHRRGRPRIVYTATASAETPPLAGYRLLAEILASELARSGHDSAERAEQAGRAWGRYLVSRRPPNAASTEEADIEAVVRLLEEFGFDPEPEHAGEGHTVIMQHCPFGEVADHYRRIVCSVHLGLMQGALAERGAHVEAEHLEPFVRPGVCAAHLERVPS